MLPDFHDPETYRIIGAALLVHRVLGCGFLEAVYREAVERELTSLEIPWAQEVPLRIVYRGEPLLTRYRADLICFGSVIVEIKAQDSLQDRDTAQLLNYLKASGLGRGLLLNFGSGSLQTRRVVRRWRGVDPSPARGSG
jgi:GxxExxY protein